MLSLRGRDSRVVRAAFSYVRWKKNILELWRQGWRRLTCRTVKTENLSVFFWLPGGLGDAACARRLVSAYRALLPGARFEIYCPISQAAQTVFAGMKDVYFAADNKRYWKAYDLVVQACLTAKFLYADKARLAEKAPEFLPVLEKALSAQASLGELLADPFLTEPALGRWLLKSGGRRFDLLAYTGGVSLLQDASERLPCDGQARKKFGLYGAKYITFHDGNFKGTPLACRMWPPAYWDALLQKIKERFADIKIVQLGSAESAAYTQADICLVGKTSLTELPDLLAGALLHIDTESGLVQLAQYTPARSVVLFGPTDTNFFGYARNVNLSAGSCGGCMWMTPTWTTHCPLNHEQAICMRALTAERVFQAVEELVGN